jgi:serine/threonine protein kinase
MLLITGYLLAGKYEIVRLGERGGMALLYEVRHQELNLPLALKILMATQESDPVQTGYFQSEARALAQLRHPGVPVIVDLGTLEGHPYLLMEWLEGETLSARLKRLGRMELGAVLSVCQQIGSVLIAAHDRRIVHRDLKPDNGMIVADRDPEGVLRERAKLLDFGIAKLLRNTQVSAAVKTRADMIMGSPVSFSRVV